MKKLLPILIGLSLSGFSSLSQAENLMQVYQQARLSNPELRKSAADRDAAFEKINEARSPLLPQLGLGADYTYSNGYRDANGINSNATSASLQLTQSIFDMSKWRALTLQEKAAGIQDVTYQTDQQTLILNTATAYFNVLNAIDVLSYTQAQKEAIYRQLDQTTQRFNVGLVAITDVQNARAQYDTVLANEVTARNNLDNAVEQLRQITGNYHPELAALPQEEMRKVVLRDVRKLLGVKSEPAFEKMFYWEHAIPQYNIGYGDIIESASEAEKHFNSLALIGSYRGGVGVGACIENALKAADSVAEKCK